MTHHTNQIGKLLAVATLLVSSSAQATDPAPTGTLSAAVDLASHFLQLVSVAAAAQVNIEYAAEEAGLADRTVFVAAIAANESGRRLCEITLVEKTLANETAWTVDRYKCGAPVPALAPLKWSPSPPPPPSCTLPPPSH